MFEVCFFLGFLLVSLVCQFVFRKEKRARKIFLALFSLAVFYFLSKAILSTFLTYRLWQANPISHYLLPPYQSISYFLSYSFFHFFRPFVFNFFFSLFLFLAMVALNNFFQERFFEKEEPYLAALASFFCFWPTNLIYLFLVLFLGVIFHFLYLIFKWREKKRFERRISFYYLWLPLSFFVIIFNHYFVSIPFFEKLLL